MFLKIRLCARLSSPGRAASRAAAGSGQGTSNPTRSDASRLAAPRRGGRGERGRRPAAGGAAPPPAPPPRAHEETHPFRRPRPPRGAGSPQPRRPAGPGLPRLPGSGLTPRLQEGGGAGRCLRPRGFRGAGPCSPGTCVGREGSRPAASSAVARAPSLELGPGKVFPRAEHALTPAPGKQAAARVGGGGPRGGLLLGRGSAERRGRGEPRGGEQILGGQTTRRRSPCSSAGYRRNLKIGFYLKVFRVTHNYLHSVAIAGRTRSFPALPQNSTES